MSSNKEHNDEEVLSLHSESEHNESSQSENSEEEDSDEEDGSEVNIDLTDNEYYKGMCTLLEDENGNNILRYIDLLCEHTKEIADNVKSLESMKQDIHRIAKSFEKFVSLHEQMMMPHRTTSSTNTSSPPPVPSVKHSNSDERSVKKSSHSNDDVTVKSSKTQKSSKH